MKFSNLFRARKVQYASALIIRITGAGLMYLMNVLLARAIGADSYGVVAIGLAWGLVALGLCSFGFNLSSMRFVAAYLHSEKPDLLRSFLRLALRVTTGGVLIAAIASLGVWMVGERAGILDPRNGQAFLMAIPLILIFPFLELAGGIQRGFDGVVRALVPYNLVFPTIVIITAYFLYYFSGGYTGVTSAFMCLYMGALAALFIAVFMLFSVWPNGIVSQKKSEKIEWIKVSLGVLPTVIVNTSIRQIDAIILSFFVSPSEIALYWIAGRITRFSSFGLQAAHMVASPQFARLKEEADGLGLLDIKSDPAHRQKMQSVVSGATKATAIMAIPSVVFIASAAPFLLSLAGEGYNQGLPILYIILFGELVNVACGPNGAFMNMTGLQNKLAKILTVIMVLYIPLIIVGGMTFGIIGAAVAVSFTTVIQNFSASLAVYRAFGVNTTMFSRLVWKF